MAKPLGTYDGWACHPFSYTLFIDPDPTFRLCHAITLVLDVRGNNFWSHRPTRFWGVLEIPA